MLKIVLSQILDRLIRSWGSLRRREGSGALKGSGVLKEEKRTNFFFSIVLSFSFLSLSPELMITQQNNSA